MILVENSTSENEERIGVLEERVDLLTQLIAEIEEGLTGIADLVAAWLTHLPKGLREQMVCGALEDSGEDEMTGLGLHCTLNEKGQCKCEG